MRQKFNFALLAALTVLLAGPSFAQTVAYSGKLQIGFGDQDNTVASLARTNNAIPICAGNPPSNPISIAPAGTTLGTLIVNARGDGGAGVGAPLTFSAVDSSTVGGAQEFENSNCNVQIQGFANPRLRSRTQVGAAHWPGRKGPFTSMIASAPVPSPLTATYMVSAGGGNTFAGAAITTTVPFLGAGNALESITKGAAVYGGGIPFSGGGGVQLGVNIATTFGGAELEPGDFGLISYASGFLPTDPQVFGTDAKGVGILNGGVTASVPTTYPVGVLLGRQDLTYALRTPGGTTQAQGGLVRTAGGGNTVTPSGTIMFPVGPSTFATADCVLMIPFPCPSIISPVAFSGAFFEWTTGDVQHTDMVGDFTTIRTAMGSDTALVPSAGNGNATRRLQLVAPWAASIKVIGTSFGLAALLPQLGFGGVSILDINVIPVPEPGTLAMLGFGVVGLAGLRSARRRNG